jgi:hypothetical protein
VKNGTVDETGDLERARERRLNRITPGIEDNQDTHERLDVGQTRIVCEKAVWVNTGAHTQITQQTRTHTNAEIELKERHGDWTEMSLCCVIRARECFTCQVWL